MDTQDYQAPVGGSTLAAKLANAVATLRDHYICDTRDIATGKQKKRQRDGVTAVSVQALENDLASVLRSVVNARQYKVKASAGQPDRSFVLIPYAMLLRNDVTATPQEGVYIALLFQEDLKALWLTLNQGMRQFEKRYSLRSAHEYLSRASKTIAASIVIPEGFRAGRIDLVATYPYGQAYEQGSILGKRYALDNFVEEQGQMFLDDLRNLIGVYETLPAYSIKDPSITVIDLRTDGDEDSYQKQANADEGRITFAPVDDVPIVAPSLRKGAGKKGAWVRDASVAKVALNQAGYRCEADCGHELFRAAAANHPYVEAHHLIPMAKQDGFEFSLDVPANVVALCPSCHSKVHRGHKGSRAPLLLKLYQFRAKRLEDSGLKIDARTLLAMY